MKTWNIIVKPNPKEVFSPEIASVEGKIVLTGVKADKLQRLYQTNLFDVLGQARLRPASAVADLLNLAMSVYTVDQIVSRATNGFLGWSRHLRMFVPVRQLSVWNPLRAELEELLSFLSGDKWEIIFRQSSEKEITRQNVTSDVDRVALFSGGLDSYIAAINLLESKRKIVFVSHYKAGGTEKNVQEELIQKLSKKYGKERIVSHQIIVQPNQKHKAAEKEVSSRARSFLFLCLGLAFANCYGPEIEFVVPENGLISLNVPLTGTRLGSHSTRTTHPHFLQAFRKIMPRLGIANPIKNPYQLQTKGEMMLSCKNTEFLQSTYQVTLSCSHGDISRYAGKAPGMHCGYCVPCIIRQAAEKKSEMKKTKYVNAIKRSPPSPMIKSGSDLRAFKLAIERLGTMSRHAIMFDLLSAGPLPFVDLAQLQQYLDTYVKGMDEVKAFLRK